MRLMQLCATVILAVVSGVAGGAAAQTPVGTSASPSAPLELIWVENVAPAPKGAPMALATRARNAIVIDVATGEILGVKSAERAIPPASMTKLMTVLLAFEALQAGDIALEDRVRVSKRATDAPGSTMFIPPGSRATIEDLIRGTIVVSGNDSAIALAETIGGSEAEFARLMTRRAREIGWESASFRNATGLPQDGHRISVEDLAWLAVYLIEEHPLEYAYFAETSMSYGGVTQKNRNPAVHLDLSDVGARGDGLKTGHTREAGYCVVASAVVETANGPRRVVVVLAGLRSERERAEETERILRWAIEWLAR